MEESINAQQQLSRRNCLLLHGIEETKGEDTDKGEEQYSSSP